MTLKHSRFVPTQYPWTPGKRAKSLKGPDTVGKYAICVLIVIKWEENFHSHYHRMPIEWHRILTDPMKCPLKCHRTPTMLLEPPD